MFICKDDHDKIEEKRKKEGKGTSHSFESHLLKNGDVVLAGISYGPCEICGKIKDCVDCHR